jgi:hypothetical protein
MVKAILLDIIVNIEPYGEEISLYGRPKRNWRNFGGADGIRTHGLLDAIEARSQLRHGPTDSQHYIDMQCCR